MPRTNEPPTAVEQEAMSPGVPETELQALRALFEIIREIRDEQVSDDIFGGQSTEQRKASSRIYQANIEAAAAKIDPLLDSIDLFRQTPHVDPIEVLQAIADVADGKLQISGHRLRAISETARACIAGNHLGLPAAGC